MSFNIIFRESLVIYIYYSQKSVILNLIYVDIFEELLFHSLRVIVVDIEILPARTEITEWQRKLILIIFLLQIVNEPQCEPSTLHFSRRNYFRSKSTLLSSVVLFIVMDICTRTYDQNNDNVLSLWIFLHILSASCYISQHRINSY